jgi:hypothetical protein
MTVGCSVGRFAIAPLVRKSLKSKERLGKQIQKQVSISPLLSIFNPPSAQWIARFALSPVLVLGCGLKTFAVTRTTPGIADAMPTAELTAAVHLSPISTLSFSGSQIVIAGPPLAMQVPRRGRLDNREVGYSLLYPGDWQFKGNVVATEFATAAACESVVIVDFQPPPGSGPAVFILHSFVQICAKPLADNLMLEEFMRQTYGHTFFTSFRRTNLAGLAGYQIERDGLNTTIFLQTNRHRIQIVTAVVASPEKQAQRVTEVQEILHSLSFF